MTIDDRRRDKSTPWGYVVATDSFLTPWGRDCGALGSQGRSLYALAVQSAAEAEIVLANARDRSDMKRARIQGRLPRIRVGDHLAIVDRSEAAAWYKPGAFQRVKP